MRSPKLLSLLVAIGAVVAGMSAMPGQAKADLITNGGFETGDFTGWTFDDSGFPMYTVTDPIHSGTYAAQIAGYSYAPDTLSQTVTTTANQAYVLSFWEWQDNGTPSGLSVSWDGTTIFSNQNPSDVNEYVNFMFNVVGSGTDTVVFTAYNDPEYTYLDDVSLIAGTVATPLPSTWTLLIAGFVGLGFFAFGGSKKRTVAHASV
jgi:hypothetical protein